MKKFRSNQLLLSGVTGAMLIAALEVPFATVARASDSDAQIEMVVVTAEKREEQLQRIPLAISAYDSNALARSHIDSVAGLQNLAPSMQFGSIDGAALISVRGIGTIVLGPGEDPGVAVHMDGVYLARAQYVGASLFDVERAEVLRGPQGTVNGRNATGGAINIVTRRPTEAFEAYANASLGNYGAVATTGAISGPLSGEGLLGRLAWRTDNHDGYTRNTFTGKDLDANDQQSLRGEILAPLGSRTEFLLSADFDRVDTAGFAVMVLGTVTGLPSTAEILGGTLATGRAVNADGPNYYRRDIFGATARLTSDFDAFTLTAISGYRKLRERVGSDIDGTNIPFVGGRYTRDQWQASQEVNLVSTTDGPFQWLAGLYYLHEQQVSDETYSFTLYGFDYSFGGPPVTNSYAAYVQGSYALTNEIEVTGGLRYTYDEKRTFEYVRIPQFGINGTGNLADAWGALTPKVSIDYKPSDDALFYASVSRGFRSGGFNIGGLQGKAFSPEFVWSYEAGAKQQFFDRRLIANLALFQSNYTDMQVFQIRALAATVENAASATIRGVELEVTALPGDGFRIDFAGSYIDGKFDAFTTIDESRPLLGPLNLAGNQLPRAPKSKLNIGVEKRWEAGDVGAFTLRGEYHWTDKIYFSEFDRDLISQPAVGVWNAYATYEFEDGRYTVSAFAQNITNELIFNNKLVGAGALGFNILAATAPPRTYGVQLGVKL